MNAISWIIVVLLIVGIVLAFIASVKVMKSERCCGNDCGSCARRRCSVLKDGHTAPCSDKDCSYSESCKNDD